MGAVVGKKYKIIEPCLIPDGRISRCSLCGYVFAADVKPSMSVAFAEHLRAAHQLFFRLPDSPPPKSTP
jgi:hypothetical protein